MVTGFGVSVRLTAPRSPRVNALFAELNGLREDVFTSKEWRGFYQKDYDRLVDEGIKRTHLDRNNSIFARIAQTIEDQILGVMFEFAKKAGFRVTTLAYDGLMILNDDTRTLNLREMEASILEKTGYAMRVVEKPLFSHSFPGWPGQTARQRLVSYT